MSGCHRHFEAIDYLAQRVPLLERPGLAVRGVGYGAQVSVFTCAGNGGVRRDGGMPVGKCGRSPPPGAAVYRSEM